MPITSTVMSSAMSCSQRSSSSLSSRRISSSKRSIVSLKNRNHASSKSSYSRKETVVVSASSAKIKVVGCGGGGGNAVNRMIEAGVSVRLLFLKRSRRKSTTTIGIEVDYENLSRPFYAHESLVLKNSVFDRSFKSSVLYRKMLGFRVSARFDERDRENQNTFLFVEFESARPGRNSRKHTTHHYSTVPSLLLPSN